MTTADGIDADRSGSVSPSQELTAIVGYDGFLRDTNRAWVASLSWSPDELAAIRFIDLVHPADADATSALLDSVADSNQSANLTNAVISRDGEHQWFGWTFTAVDGGVYVVGVQTAGDADRETALTQRERRIHAQLDDEPIAIITIDSSGTVTSFSAAAQVIFGYEASEILGRNVKVLMPQPDQDEHDGYLARYVETGQTKVVGTTRDVMGLRKSGTTFPIELAVHEKVIGGVSTFVGAVQDRTSALSAQSERHAALVARQSALVARQSALVAVSANAAKNNFLSHMSHQLRTPLNAILGFAQLAELEAQTSLQKENAELILAAGRHLLSLINNVLDISLIEAGQLQVSLESVSVHEVVTECLAFVEPQASNRQISLTKRNETVMFVRADGQRLRQVLLKLLSNAVKNSFDGGDITLEVTSTLDAMARFAVTDAGPGMDPSATARIFESFAAPNPGRSASEGAGLGLATASALTKLMGGTIGFESKLGDGSTFWIELAKVEAQIDAADRNESQ